MIGETPGPANLVESILAKDIDGLEQKLTRHGYNVKTLAATANVQPKVIRSFLRGKLSPPILIVIYAAYPKKISCRNGESSDGIKST